MFGTAVERTSSADAFTFRYKYAAMCAGQHMLNLTARWWYLRIPLVCRRLSVAAGKRTTYPPDAHQQQDEQQKIAHDQSNVIRGVAV